MDLGISSMQVDQPERGFSYAADAPLDMRMDPAADLTATEIVNEWDEREIAQVLREYGEERFSRQIARAIVRRREREPFQRTGDLVDVIKAAIPTPSRFGQGHPAKRSFQALRIAVNDELESLTEGLQLALELLAPRRPDGRDQLPLAGGPDRQALHPRPGPRLHLPARLPDLRLRPRAAAAHADRAGRWCRPWTSAARTRARPRPSCARPKGRRRRERRRAGAGSTGAPPPPHRARRTGPAP